MIQPCDKPCGNKTASGYCATTACINPQYSNIGTAHYGQGVQKRIITNADRIRVMTDEELAKWLDLLVNRAKIYGENKVWLEDTPRYYADWLDWLKGEASE